MFTLNIDTANAAFHDDTDNGTVTDGAAGRAEIARILRDLAERFESGSDPSDNGAVRDINGNSVGSFNLKL